MFKLKNILTLIGFLAIFANPSFAVQIVTLDLQADDKTEHYLGSICISSFPHTHHKCGAKISRKVLTHRWHIWLYTPHISQFALGADPSCQPYLHDVHIPGKRKHLVLHSTLKLDQHFNISIVTMTHCALTIS